MFLYSERGDRSFTNFCQGNTRLGIGMSKTRKSGNRYRESPSTRDKLSSAFVDALEKDWAEHGAEVIQQIRQDNPVKYGELIARLVPMDANLVSASDFSKCQSMEEIGRKLLQSIGFADPDDASIQRAVEANNIFIDGLQQIHREAQDGMH